MEPGHKTWIHLENKGCCDCVRLVKKYETLKPKLLRQIYEKRTLTYMVWMSH